jgi:hypothetical protein
MLLGVWSCQPPTCQLQKIKTLYVTPSRQESGTGQMQVSYGHYVLLKGFSRDCLDSATIVRLAAHYRDTVSSK